MANYAVVENNIVVNTIVADSKEIAEEVTGKLCIEYTDEPAETNGTWDGSRFFPKKPFESWTWNEEYKTWTAPTPYPEIDQENIKTYVWDEATTSWIEG